MAQGTRVQGTSLTSFADAAKSAFDQLPGDPDREGLKAAEVSREWMTGGGIVGTEFHVELTASDHQT